MVIFTDISICSNVNDLKNASAPLNAIMFADDTNLFVSHKNINNLFQIVNAELKNLETWFNGNKLSKTEYTFFHPKSYSAIFLYVFRH